MTKVAHMRQALHQICADEHVPDSMTARIMAENGHISSAEIIQIAPKRKRREEGYGAFSRLFRWN